MPKRLVALKPPITGHGGEQSAVSYDGFDASEVELLHNALITGRGIVEQSPDFILANGGDALDDKGDNELNAVCGIFPFSQKGDAESANAGIAFAWDDTNGYIYMYMLDEDHAINQYDDGVNPVADWIMLAFDDWVATDGNGDPMPPQMTAFEMSNKFFFCPYGKELASSRLGMAYFDPTGIADITSSSAASPTVITATAHGLTDGDIVTIHGHTGSDDDDAVNAQHTITYIGANSFSIPVDLTGGGGTGGAVYIRRPIYDLDESGSVYNFLRFRGISRHRGGSILGWGYRYESDADRAAFLRWCEYNAPLTWIPTTDDISAGAAVIGTPGLEIVACAESDQYTIIGKESEIFAMDGDYGAQFYTRQIGRAHGPISTTGMVGIGDAAVWMSDEGPAISERGGKVQLITPDKLRRTLRRYLDLRNTWAAHDARRQRVVWTVRRSRNIYGETLVDNSERFARELLVWDYRRDAFYTQLTPQLVWSVGVTAGAGLDPPAPSAGTMTLDAATAITQNGFTINFTPNDTSPGVSYEFQYRENGTDIWTNAGTAFVPATSLALSGLEAGTTYDVRGKEVRNDQSGDWATTNSYATTDLDTSVPDDPVNVDVRSQTPSVPGGGAAQYIEVSWTSIYDDGVTATLFAGTTSTFADADPAGSADASAGAIVDSNDRYWGDVLYYWVRFSNTNGNSSEVQSSTFPYTVTGEGPEM